MKNRKKMLLCLLVTAVLLLACSGLASAASRASDVTVRLDGGCKVLVDGSQRTFYNAATGQEVFPLVYDGVTYLPLRAIGELMGRNVDWNESNLTVTLSGSRTTPAVSGSRATDRSVRRVNAQLRPDFKIVVDGSSKSFVDANGKAVYPVLCNGSVYLPLRAIGELMGKSVGWDGATKTVSLTGGAGGGLVTDADSFGGGTTSQGNTNNTNTNPTSQVIGLEAAKSAALQHAGVADRQATFTKGKLDYENGVQVYEIEFVTSDGREYEYDIVAADGSVQEWNVDYHNQQSGQTGSLIGEARAKGIALSRVSGATEANITKVKLDSGDGKYEVELVYNYRKYEFEIDAYTGNVLEWESEQVVSSGTSGGSHHNEHHSGYSYCSKCGVYYSQHSAHNC